MLCDKRFKTSDFVQKHIFNKHAEDLDRRFNQMRFDEMLKENYMEDPHKFINTFSLSGYGGYGQGEGRGGYGRDRGGDRRFGAADRRRYDRQDFEGGERRPRKDYVDYDDPTTFAATAGNPDRQLVNYDDLF